VEDEKSWFPLLYSFTTSVVDFAIALHQRFSHAGDKHFPHHTFYLGLQRIPKIYEIEF
jgi:hypothetical protein